MVMKNYFTLSEVAKILNKKKETIRRWDREGKLIAVREPMSNYRIYKKEDLKVFPEFNEILAHKVISNTVTPIKDFSVIELFAGAGGGELVLKKRDSNVNYLMKLTNGHVKP